MRLVFRAILWWKSTSFWGMLIPRPLSFLANSLIFAGGMLFAWLEGYRGQAAGGGSGLPAWLFVLLWFLVQEVLVQQAKYTWNDSRDHERDQTIPANRNRPIARRPLAKSTTYVMIGRWLIGVLLAGLLSPVLLTVVLIISSLQIVYELWAKPLAAQLPVLPLFVVGAGMVLKGGGGVMAMGWPIGDQRAWLYGLALFTTGVVVGASLWHAEATFFAVIKLPPPRGQGAYYARRGLAWIKAGTAVMIAACTLLILDGYTHFLRLTELHTGQALTLIFAAGIICCLLAFLLLSGRKTFRFIVMALFVTGCALYAWFRVESLILISNETFAAALLLVLLLLDYRLAYKIDYKQQNLVYLSENWPGFRRMARARPRQTSTLTHWRQLLPFILALNTPKYQLLQEQTKKNRPTSSYLMPADLPVRKAEAPDEGRPN